MFKPKLSGNWYPTLNDRVILYVLLKRFDYTPNMVYKITGRGAPVIHRSVDVVENEIKSSNIKISDIDDLVKALEANGVEARKDITDRSRSKLINQAINALSNASMSKLDESSLEVKAAKRLILKCLHQFLINSKQIKVDTESISDMIKNCVDLGRTDDDVKYIRFLPDKPFTIRKHYLDKSNTECYLRFDLLLRDDVDYHDLIICVDIDGEYIKKHIYKVTSTQVVEIMKDFETESHLEVFVKYANIDSYMDMFYSKEKF